MNTALTNETDRKYLKSTGRPCDPVEKLWSTLGYSDYTRDSRCRFRRGNERAEREMERIDRVFCLERERLGMYVVIQRTHATFKLLFL